MNHSPIFLQSLNRLIGRTMRQLQLASNSDVHFWIKRAIRWLNYAKRAYVHLGSLLNAKRDIENAMRCIGNARQYA